MRRSDFRNSRCFASGRWLQIAILAGVAAAAWQFGAGLTSAGSHSSPESLSRPFLLEMNVYFYGRGLPDSLAQRLVEGHRSDGGTVRAATDYRLPKPVTTRFLSLPDGTTILLLDAGHAKHTCLPKRLSPAVSNNCPTCLPQPPDCLGPLDALLGRTALSNEPVNLVKTWDRGSAGREWLAPALGCEELQWQQASVQADGSHKIAAEGKLLSLKLGEPDARLFDPAPGYQELRMSEMERWEAEASGRPWSSELEQAADRDDQTQARVCELPEASH